MFSDESRRFIEAGDPVNALKMAVEAYDHPCGLFAANITTCEPEPKVMARFLSARAVAQEDASRKTEGCIMGDDDRIRILKNGKEQRLYVNNYKARMELYGKDGKKRFDASIESIKPFKLEYERMNDILKADAYPSNETQEK
jgi:hypothetical protein